MKSSVKEHDRTGRHHCSMKEGTGLVRFEKKYPDRLFDVGIAEEHAVSFCQQGLATWRMDSGFVAILFFLPAESSGSDDA